MEEKESGVQKRYASTTEVILITGLSAETLRGLEKRERFPRRKTLSEKARRWWLPDVMEWMKDPEAWRGVA